MIPRKAQRVLFKLTTRKLFVSLCNIRSAVREHPRSIISQQNDLDIIWIYYDGGEWSSSSSNLSAASYSLIHFPDFSIIPTN